MKTLFIFVILLAGPYLAGISAGAAATVPTILYTDVPTGPTNGGENGLGGYLSIYGVNFGPASGLGTTTKAYIGGVEVANYRSLGPAIVGTKLAIQELTVQVGSLSGAAVGTPLNVSVVVGGVSSVNGPDAGAVTFTPTAGRVIFVSLSGNDANALTVNPPGDMTHPFRYLQNYGATAGAYYSLKAGDQVVLRGGTYSDVNGVDSDWLRFLCSPSSTPKCAPVTATNGTASAWITFTAYPGPTNGNAPENVLHQTPSGASGSIAGPWSDIGGSGTGAFVAISNLHFTVLGGAAGDAAPINMQYGSGPWRVVNLEIGPWTAGNSASLNAAGVSGHGDGILVLGNYIHDIQGTSALQNHGIYADTTAKNWVVAYNWIVNSIGGSGIQFNDNSACAGTPVGTNGCGWTFEGYVAQNYWDGFTGIQIHHNYVDNAAKYGINFNDQGSTHAGTYSGRIWNNVIANVNFFPIRINATQPNQQLWYSYNTIYNSDKTTSVCSSVVETEGVTQGAGILNKFYDNIFALGPQSASDSFICDYSQLHTSVSFDFKNNLYYDAGKGIPAVASDASAVSGNPQFTNAAVSDFTLLAASPARNSATQTSPFVVGDDFLGVPRPSTPPPSIGAYEYVSAAPLATAQHPFNFKFR